MFRWVVNVLIRVGLALVGGLLGPRIIYGVSGEVFVASMFAVCI